VIIDLCIGGWFVDCMVIVVNMFNMLMMVCEVSIYVVVIVVEYYCDMGYLVVVVVDLIL